MGNNKTVQAKFRGTFLQFHDNCERLQEVLTPLNSWGSTFGGSEAKGWTWFISCPPEQENAVKEACRKHGFRV